MIKTIYYHDTDCGGVVYYANYLKYFEEGRSEILEQGGFSLQDLIKKGFIFAVAKQEVEYKYPCFYGDKINIETKVLEFSPVKIIFENTITNQNGRLTTKGKTTLVCVNAQGSVQSMPKEMQDALATLTNTPL